MSRWVLAAAAGGGMVLLAGVGAVAGARTGPSAASENVLDGFCEASAIVPWGDGFLVADNETDTRLYGLSSTLASGAALALSAPVEDIEALAIGPAGELLVVGSQSANKKGKPQPERELLLVQGGAAIRPDLSGCAECVAARALPPKEGGLSVEGAAWWEGSWWLGVRSPLVHGEALLLRLEGDPAEAVSVAETRTVDLDGAGIRDLVVGPDGLLILSGPVDGRAEPHGLYRVAGGGPAERLPFELPSGSEGFVLDGMGFLVVTDGDGKPGTACKVPATWARVGLSTPTARSP